MTPAELVLAQFPGRVYIPLVEAGAAIGMQRQTCYNSRVKGTFPLPVRLVGRKPMVALTDLIIYLEKHTKAPPPRTVESVVKKRVGRPRNADRM
jgi:hypothetical protein